MARPYNARHAGSLTRKPPAQSERDRLADKRRKAAEVRKVIKESPERRAVSQLREDIRNLRLRKRNAQRRLDAIVGMMIGKHEQLRAALVAVENLQLRLER